MQSIDKIEDVPRCDMFSWEDVLPKSRNGQNAAMLPHTPTGTDPNTLVKFVSVPEQPRRWPDEHV